LRRHRVRGLPQPQHDPPAAGPQRDRGRAAAVCAAARGAGPAAAAGTADRADGTGHFGPGLAASAGPPGGPLTAAFPTRLRCGADEVPLVAGDVEEYGDAAVGFGAWRGE